MNVLNPPRSLIAAHDKLATSRALADAGVAHPRTVQVTAPTAHIPIEPPVVAKPRFGSWGRDVVLCPDTPSLRRSLAELAHRRWFKSHGALVQELVPPQGEDLRLLVAGGKAVGAIRRVAAPGEWRTNVALGATRLPVEPPLEARALATAAARAIEADLVGVDLLPRPDGGYVVIEINGAVEFTGEYALDETDVFAQALDPLDARIVSAVA